MAYTSSSWSLREANAGTQAEQELEAGTEVVAMEEGGCLLLCSSGFASCAIQDQRKEEAPPTVGLTPTSVINQKYGPLVDRPVSQLRFPLPREVSFVLS